MGQFQLPLSTEVFSSRAYAKGKFLYQNDEKLYLKGVTYGTFKPSEEGHQFPDLPTVEKDFRMMMNSGFNCVRTYTVPSIEILNLALKYNLKIMVGMPWEQHITFLDEKGRKSDILKRVRRGIEACQRHPSVLCYTIGNEIPAQIVRWYGKKRIEGFLKQLYDAVKEIDADSLVTYVNYPTTEYIDLSFLDFYCFNVYLETPEKLGSYLAKLHNISRDKPLVLAEIGLDSLRNGTESQASTLEWQIKTIFGSGCAGMFVFAWTDEWWRGGFEIEDWNFGIVDRNRFPKPALFAVRRCMAKLPFYSKGEDLPLISVVVCSYNGSVTIRDCLKGVMSLDYPNYEVLVINDGSTDNLAEIVNGHPVTLVSTPNQGLSVARNIGLNKSEGEIITYIDDDAYPDPHWLRYLAYAFQNSDHAAIGGPNLSPHEDGPIAKCVANAPGGPVHVLLSDDVAEHIPGCNMSFKREALLETGGFDPVFRSAGDDVDICWRLQEAGKTIGFHPSALVWHHRRNSIAAYWKQQKGYGKAEALLEAKWPQKYNSLGHYTWAGRVYGYGFTLPLKYKKEKVFHGMWGTALFQSIYQKADGLWSSLPLMPEWYMLTGLMAILGALGFLWSPLLWCWLLFMVSTAVVFVQAAISASKTVLVHSKPKGKMIMYMTLITLFHLIQPLARLYGRITNGLTMWRIRGAEFSFKHFFSFKHRVFTHWSEGWRTNEDWLIDIEKNLNKLFTRVRRGGDFDEWDLEIQNGLFSSFKTVLAVEEHGGGKQNIRLKCWLKPSFSFFIIIIFFILLGSISAHDNHLVISGLFVFVALALCIRYFVETAVSINTLNTAVLHLNKTQTQVEGKNEENGLLQGESENLPHDQGINHFETSRYNA